MSATYTTNVGLAKPGVSDRGWDVTLNADLDALDALLGNGAVRRNEHPSTTRNIRIGASQFLKYDGTYATLSSSTLLLGASTTTYVYINSSGAIASNTTGFPAIGAGCIRLAVVVTDATTVTSVTDARFLLTTEQHQRSGAAQTALTDSTGGDVSAFTLADVTGSHSQSILNANFARAAKLLNELRAAMVEAGIIKGSA